MDHSHPKNQILEELLELSRAAAEKRNKNIYWKLLNLHSPHYEQISYEEFKKILEELLQLSCCHKKRAICQYDLTY